MVSIPGKKPFQGRQSAFSKDEVASALTKMGYQKYTINPVLFDLPIKPSNADIMMFIKLSATMLRDKMSFGKILEMLAEEQTNRAMKEALGQIETQLKAGAEGKEVFNRFGHIFGKFPAYMLVWPPAAVIWPRCLTPPVSLSSGIWKSARASSPP
jgi:type IV pilus assembly protein PilC